MLVVYPPKSGLHSSEVEEADRMIEWLSRRAARPLLRAAGREDAVQTLLSRIGVSRRPSAFAVTRARASLLPRPRMTTPKL